MAICVPKSLVKIFVSIGIVMRKRRKSARRFCRAGVSSHRRGTPPVAGTGSAIYFAPPEHTVISVYIVGIFFRGESSGRYAFRRRTANMKIS